ncbi:PspC domain-containing protein [Nocardioides baekrokdamisoli]|nr:PspC domain-containing protein [Nocardioides baekrokdamisoli]
MTTSPDDTAVPEDVAPRPADPVRDLSRLRRTTAESPYGRHIAGVAGGLARHFDIDPLVVRIALVVSMMFGVGVFVYAALWLLVPEDGKHHAPIHLDARTRTVLLWGTAAVAAVWLLGLPFGTHDWFPWPLVVIGIVVAVVTNRRERRRSWASPIANGSVSPQTNDTTVMGAAGEPTYVAPRPRRNGPVWFGFALATIAVGEGILGLMAAAGHHPNLGAYPALALAVIGAYLIVGAFWGRAGGLIALGIVAAFATVVGTAGNGVGQGKTLDITPTSAAAVMPSYSLGTGSLTVDLTQVSDQKALDGRVLDLNGTFGRIQLIVPSGTGVIFHGTVRGAGSIQTWDDEHDGPRATYDHTFPAAAGHPTITVDASIRFGAIQLRSE